MLTREVLDHLCRLARIRLPAGEEERFLADLERIRGYVAVVQEMEPPAEDAREISEADVTPGQADEPGTPAGDPPAPARPDDVPARWRPDEVGPSLALGEVLANAPQVEENCFAVPPVLEAAVPPWHGSRGSIERATEESDPTSPPEDRERRS